MSFTTSGGRRLADVHDEVRVLLGDGRAADLAALEARQLDEPPGRGALLRVAEDAARVGLRERLALLARLEEPLHLGTDPLGIALLHAQHALDDDAEPVQSARPVLPGHLRAAKPPQALPGHEDGHRLGHVADPAPVRARVHRERTAERARDARPRTTGPTSPALNASWTSAASMAAGAGPDVPLVRVDDVAAELVAEHEDGARRSPSRRRAGWCPCRRP